jgi:hypothetical protein
VARHARRVVRMRDGKIVSDLPVERDVEVHAAPAPIVEHPRPGGVGVPVGA